MWVKIFIAVALTALVGIIYLVSRFHRFRCLEQLGQKHKLLSWVIAALLAAGILSTAFLFNRYTMPVLIIYFMVIWIFCDLTAWIIRKIRKKERTRNYAGGAALLLTFAVLGAGWYFAHHIYRTAYSVRSDKLAPDAHLRAVMLADTHLGLTLNGEKFTALCSRIQQENPDLVLICGDFVDDESEKADMLAACEALGKLSTEYGVFYVYGNHDRGYFHYRDFTDDELAAELTENGVKILYDETAEIADEYYICGRRDCYDSDRKTAQELTEPLDQSKYIIMLDHQPNDYDAEAAAGADLVLSGHTHGGQLFPAGLIGLAIGANDRVYGTEMRGNTQFIVTSGASGWAIPFKTGCISEYCVIDIAGK